VEFIACGCKPKGFIAALVGVTSSSLTMSAMSSTFRAHYCMHSLKERHFALVDGLRVSSLGSL
jgi:hypothetical protein